MEFLRLQRSVHFKASHLCRMYGRPGHGDIRTAICLTCQLRELNWNWHHEDYFVCSRCRDLAKQSSHQRAFLKLFPHRANTLPSLFFLPYLFEYLYPEVMRHKHTRIQQTRSLKLFLLGLSGTTNSLFALHVQSILLQNFAHLRMGKTYYHPNRHHAKDLLTIVCLFLI